MFQPPRPRPSHPKAGTAKKFKISYLFTDSAYRHWVQALGWVAFHPQLGKYFRGEIYQGKLKKLCVPVLNCWSCPGAWGSCPIGALQAVGGKGSFPFYVLGLLTLFGLMGGRFFCGYLCPFGFLQDLFYKLRTPKVKVPKKTNRILSWVKYVNLFLIVLALPMVLGYLGIWAPPFFCKYFCPEGMVGASLPLLVQNPKAYLSNLGPTFFWKAALAIGIVSGSVFIYRIFCRWLCPLGAFLGLFNRVSFYRFEVRPTCIHCNRCHAVCKLDLDPVTDPNSPECIRCRDCLQACWVKALQVQAPWSQEEGQQKREQQAKGQQERS